LFTTIHPSPLTAGGRFEEGGRMVIYFFLGNPLWGGKGGENKFESFRMAPSGLKGLRVRNLVG